MQTKFEPRMGIMWEDEGGERMRYGVITRCGDGMVEAVRVLPLTDDIFCYDEGRNYAADRDNVRLESAPPPFSLLCVMEDVGQCYAVATPYSPVLFAGDELSMLSVVDDGDKISEEDFDTIFHHPWPEQPEKELAPCRCGTEKPQPETETKKLIPPSVAMLQAVLERDSWKEEGKGKKGKEDDGPAFGW